MTTAVETRPIGALRLHPDAEQVPLATAGDLDQLRASLREYGQQDPIDVSTDGLILDGRTRWTLLKELRGRTVQVRVVDVSELEQTHYIVDRALSRRHLTSKQKQALNSLLRRAVVEVAEDRTGEEVRIGMSGKQRAEKLGVTALTVKRWDQQDRRVPVTNDTGAAAPTHVRREDTGALLPLSSDHPATTEGPREPLRKSRQIPHWSRHASRWLRSARPEDRAFLRRLDQQLHEALTRNGIECQKEQP